MRVAIIGGGLAGTACAFVLRQHGIEPVLYEVSDHLAAGASGNDIGLYNPRFSAFRTPESDYFSAAFSLFLRTVGQFSDVDWNPCGALHLMIDDKKEKRFRQTYENWGWPEQQMRIVSASEASAIAGINIEYDALYLPQSGAVSPRKLCMAYAQGIDVRLGHKVERLEDVQADIVILACGAALREFEQTAGLPVKYVRGQVTKVKATDSSAQIKTALCYSGYLAPALNGQHMVGSTFQRWLSHSNIMEQDDVDNIEKLERNIPALAGSFEVNGQWAACRTTAMDHFPIVGEMPGHQNVYISTAHGSHGILSSLAAAHLIVDMITQRPYSQSVYTANALSPARFLDRMSDGNHV